MHEKSNILSNLKPKSKIFENVYQKSRQVCLAKSLKTIKSHARLPLNSQSEIRFKSLSDEIWYRQAPDIYLVAKIVDL